MYIGNIQEKHLARKRKTVKKIMKAKQIRKVYNSYLMIKSIEKERL
jgi:hypothetical protein